MSNELGQAPISHIKQNLDRLFGVGAWADWEIETISMALNLFLDEITRDKIQLLQALELQPDLPSEDAAFFLHSVDIINNKVADFEYLPTPTSLELAFAISEYEKLGMLQNLKAPNSGVSDICWYILNEEGYSEPVGIFSFLDKSRFTAGQTPEDTEAKKRAITKYIKEMSNT